MNAKEFLLTLPKENKVWDYENEDLEYSQEQLEYFAEEYYKNKLKEVHLPDVIGVVEPSDKKLVEACCKYYEMKHNCKFSSPVKQSIIESWIDFYRFIYKEAQK